MTTKIDGTKYPFENEATDEAGVLPTHDEMMRLVFNNKSVGRVIIYSTTNSDKDGFVNAFNNNLKSLFMFKSQVIPYGNLVLVERTHLVSKVDMRGTKDVLIPAPIEQKVIAIGETVTKPISVGDIVYCNPNPFFGIIMNFDDNDYEFDKVRKQIADEDKKAMNPILVPSTSRGVAKKLPDFNDKVTIVTHMMMMETDVLCKVKPVEYTFMASPESPVTLKN